MIRRFTAEERKHLLAARWVGIKTIQCLEEVGYDDMEELAKADAAFICSLIAGYSGIPGWATHSMAKTAVENAIAAANWHGH